MAATRPKARAPRRGLDVAPPPAPAAAPTLVPAPDSGIPYAARPARATAEPSTADKKRRGRQLGHRVPDDLYDRLVACADETGISQQRLIVRGLDEVLTSHGF